MYLLLNVHWESRSLSLALHVDRTRTYADVHFLGCTVNRNTRVPFCLTCINLSLSHKNSITRIIIAETNVPSF